MLPREKPQLSASSTQVHFQDVKYPPEVHPDGRVTFRLKAPLAQKVQIEPVSGQPGDNGYNGLGKSAYDMTRNEQGVPWISSITLCPQITYSGGKLPTPADEERLHHLAHQQCFIANSIKTNVKVKGAAQDS